ncbi:MAG TPA: hypothetical protein PKX23_02710, partial [Verrucomicrobiota bacterium]|nr:hypothetical protein [Verrucomicrobiota bacterium]
MQKTTTKPRSETSSWRRAGLCAALALATVAFFWPTLGNDFVQYDDQDYVTQNPHILRGLSWEGFRWAFGEAYAANWHPLTWISHALDVELFGLNATGHHLSSLLWHAANAVLLMMLLQSLTRQTGRSFMVAGLFALHPLRVESVAWVAERKDLLSGFFFLLALLAYSRFVSLSRNATDAEGRFGKGEPASPRFSFRPIGFYILALVCHGAGLMSKPMVVTLPFVLLLLDYWPWGRLKSLGPNDPWRAVARLLLEKAPFFLLSGVSAVVTLQVQAPAKLYFAGLPFSLRLANAVVACARYLGKTLWPADLAVFYPHPGRWPNATVLIATVIILGLSAGLVVWGRRRPWLAVGWLWFVGMLVPVLGLVQVGVQSMADRYTYLPSVGIAIMIAWGIPNFIHRESIRKRFLFPAAIAMLILLAVITFKQCGYWKNSVTLFSQTLRVTKNNHKIHHNLGVTFFK